MSVILFSNFSRSASILTTCNEEQHTQFISNFSTQYRKTVKSTKIYTFPNFFLFQKKKQFASSHAMHNHQTQSNLYTQICFHKLPSSKDNLCILYFLKRFTFYYLLSDVTKTQKYILGNPLRYFLSSPLR